MRSKQLVRTAFVMEQTLGHVTHARNLEAVVAGQTGIDPTWLPISFAPRGPERFMPMVRSNWSVRASWRARRALNATLARKPLDAIVFHTQVTALFSRRLMGTIPTVISLDATPINYDSVGAFYGHQAASNGLLDRRKYQLNRDALHAAAALVTWSDWARQSVIDDYGVSPAKVRVLAPGAAPDYFDIGARRSASSTRSDGPVRLLFVGGDFRRKGGPALLECMRGQLAGRCELHLVTQADIPPQSGVFVYRGLEPNSRELLRLFSDADMFVLPTMAECLAVVLMEATAAGLPVITTDVGALGEAVRPGKTGMLLQPGDTHGLAAAIEVLLADPTLRRSMGMAGHSLARQKFDARSNNQALLRLIQELSLGSNRTRRAA